MRISLPRPKRRSIGVIRKNDRGRLVLLPKRGGDAWPVRLTRDSRLRVGDTVHARLVEGQAVISAVNDALDRTGRSVARSRVRAAGTSSPKAISAGGVYIVPNGHGTASDGDTVAAEVTGEESFGLTGRVVVGDRAA